MNGLLQLRRELSLSWRISLAGGMHLCGAFVIILALLFTAQSPPFPALFER
jgi:hypothetical protein